MGFEPTTFSLGRKAKSPFLIAPRQFCTTKTGTSALQFTDQSGGRESNPQQPRWERGTLPLSYRRVRKPISK